MAGTVSLEVKKKAVYEKLMAETKEFKETLCYMPDYQAVEEFGRLSVMELFTRVLGGCDISEECIDYFYGLIQETEEPLSEVLWNGKFNDIDYLYELSGKAMAKDIEDYAHRQSKIK